MTGDAQQGDIAGEVLALLARERGLPLARLVPEARLRQDLGMDGDDAVDFFIDIHQRFGTDLSALQQNWQRYFSPEGVSLWNIVVTIAVIVPLAATGGAIGAALHWPEWAAFGLGCVFILLTYWIVWKLRKLLCRTPETAEAAITIATLIDAVKAGAWPQTET